MIAALLIAIPLEVTWSKYVWQYDPANYTKIVQWAGCTAAVDMDADDSVVNSYYIPGYHVLHVGTRPERNSPYYVGLVVLLHETGHCLQFQGAVSPDEQADKYQNDPVRYELDADRQAAEMACGIGLDGKKLLLDTFTWAHDAFGYDGDPGHGTLYERIHADDFGSACMKRVESWALISSF